MVQRVHTMKRNSIPLVWAIVVDVVRLFCSVVAVVVVVDLDCVLNDAVDADDVAVVVGGGCDGGAAGVVGGDVAIVVVDDDGADANVDQLD